MAPGMMGKEEEPAWEQPHHAVQGQPLVCLLPLQENHHSPSRSIPGGGGSPPLIHGGFVLAQGAQEPGVSQAGWPRPRPSSSSAVSSIILLCLLRIILTLAILPEQCQWHGQTLKGPRLLSSAAFCPFMCLTLPVCSSPQEEGAAGSAPCAQPQQGWVALVPPYTTLPCPTPN